MINSKPESYQFLRRINKIFDPVKKSQKNDIQALEFVLFISLSKKEKFQILVALFKVLL
jgi:hypothetical protein